MTNKFKVKNFTILTNSQGLPWIEAVNYPINNIPVYIYCSVDDEFLMIDVIEQECRRYLKNYLIIKK